MWKEALFGLGAIITWCIKALVVMLIASIVATMFGVVLLVIMSDMRVERENFLSDYEDKEQVEYLRQLRKDKEEAENARILRRKLRREQFDQKCHGETEHQQISGDAVSSEQDPKGGLLPGQD